MIGSIVSGAKSLFSKANKIVGSPLGAAGLDFFGNWWAGEKSAASAKDQMKFQEKMSNTAYQRAMADMRKAGLNPILAARLGGASTPSGAMYNQPAPNLSGSVASGFQNMKAVQEEKRIEQEVEQVRTNIRLLKAKTTKTWAEEVLVEIEVGLRMAQTETEKNRILTEKWRGLTQKQQYRIMKRLAQESDLIAEAVLESEPGQWLPILRYIFGGFPNPTVKGRTTRRRK